MQISGRELVCVVSHSAANDFFNSLNQWAYMRVLTFCEAARTTKLSEISAITTSDEPIVPASEWENRAIFFESSNSLSLSKSDFCFVCVGNIGGYGSRLCADRRACLFTTFSSVAETLLRLFVIWHIGIRLQWSYSRMIQIQVVSNCWNWYLSSRIGPVLRTPKSSSYVHITFITIFLNRATGSVSHALCREHLPARGDF